MRWHVEVRVFIGVLLLSACGDRAPVTAGVTPVLPDTATVDGILTMRHDADAFARAPRWTLDSVPLVVFDGGDAPAFQLADAWQAMMLRDGRFLAFSGERNPRLMLFNRDGTPGRVIMRDGTDSGSSFGILRSSLLMVLDTAVVIDERPWSIAMYFDVDAGLVRTDSIPAGEHPRVKPIDLLSGGRAIVMKSSWSMDEMPVRAGRLSTPIIVWQLGARTWDTVAVLEGEEMADPIPPGGSVHQLRFGRSLQIAAWDSVIVTGNGDRGYHLELRTPAGPVIATIAVDAAQRAVSKQVRVDDSTRRDQYVRRYAAMHPPHGQIIVGTDGVLWVMDSFVRGDSVWTATAFRRDGAIIGRLSGPGNTTPYGFGDGRVLVAQFGDGQPTTFALHAIASHGQR